MTYKLFADDGETGNASGWVRNLETGELIALHNPGDDGGVALAAYKAWLDEGNTPEPA